MNGRTSPLGSRRVQYVLVLMDLWCATWMPPKSLHLPLPRYTLNLSPCVRNPQPYLIVSWSLSRCGLVITRYVRSHHDICHWLKANFSQQQMMMCLVKVSDIMIYLMLWLAQVVDKINHESLDNWIKRKWQTFNGSGFSSLLLLLFFRLFDKTRHLMM